MARFCARFLGGSTSWTKMVHTVFQNLNRTKKQKRAPKPLFFCNNLDFVVKHQKPVLEQNGTPPPKIKWAPWCFFLCKNWFCLKSQLVMFDKNNIFYRFLRLLALDLLARSFFFWPFVFWVFLFFGFLFVSCCCCFIKQVSMFWSLFHVAFLISLVSLLVFFWICFEKGIFAYFWMSPFVSF